MEGQTVRLALSLTGGAKNLAGFRVSITYDTSKLSFQKAELADWVKTSDYYTNAASNTVCSVYTSDLSAGSVVLPEDEIAVYQFKVLPSSGKTNISLHIDQIYDINLHPIDIDVSMNFTVELNKLPPSNVRLLSLVPSSGTLQPAFSPDCFSYELSVGSDVSSVEFETEASEGCSVSVSRKKLSAAGKETSISIIVSDTDKKDKAVYQILVKRSATGSENQNTGGSGKTSRPSSDDQAEDGTHGNGSDGLSAGTSGNDGTGENHGQTGGRELFVEGSSMTTFLLIGAIVLLASALFFVGYAILKNKKTS